MLAAYLAAAALVVVLSLLAGGAVLALCGRRDLSALAPAVGLAAVLAACGIATDLGAGEAALALVLAALALASLAALTVARRGDSRARGGADRRSVAGALAAALLAGLLASLPFIAAGRIGILGVGLVNDDMASHLLLADWIREGFRPEPVLVDQGYPLGPHSLVSGLGWALGARTIDVFAGLIAAIAALSALTAHGLLCELRALPRALVSALVAIPYLTAAYLAQEAFKEPIMALLALAFAAALGARRPAGAGALVPLAVLAAGVLYVYSFPGLAWLAGTAGVLGLVALGGATRRSNVPDPSPWRRSLDVRRLGERRRVVAALAALAVLVLLTAADWGRLLDFADFRALDPDRANEGGLGNLRGQISPLEALGVWPTSEFRLQPGASDLPAMAFYLGGLLGLAALAAGLPGWLRRHGPAVPAALVAALGVYLGALAFGTVYTSAKALAVAAPLVILIALGGLLGRSAGETSPATPGVGRRGASSRARLGAAALALLFGLAAAGSSFLVLRQAPVAPEDHAEELAEIRPLVAGRDLLFLGRDNFILWELRGSRPYTHVRNFYDPYFVEPNFELAEVGSKFDFDSLEAAKLAEFPFVLTTRAPYASGPPPGYRALAVTDSYVLWKRGPTEPGRRPVEAGPEPGAELACEERVRGEAAVWRAPPLVAEAAAWSPDGDIGDGEQATLSLELPAGAWDLSLFYDSTAPLRLSADGLEATLPGNLDYRGVTPPWYAASVELERAATLELTASVEPPPAAGRLLGASSLAHLGAVAATPAGPNYVPALDAVAPGAGARLDPARPPCGEYADWTTPERGGSME